MLGILVHGDNHFIVSGALPSYAAARRLVRHWEMPLLRAVPAAPPQLPWALVTRAFRENLEWAIVLEGERPAQPAVAQLLAEIAARGVAVLTGSGPLLPESEAGRWAGLEWPPED